MTNVTVAFRNIGITPNNGRRLIQSPSVAVHLFRYLLRNERRR